MSIIDRIIIMVLTLYSNQAYIGCRCYTKIKHFERFVSLGVLDNGILKHFFLKETKHVVSRGTIWKNQSSVNSKQLKQHTSSQAGVMYDYFSRHWTRQTTGAMQCNGRITITALHIIGAFA